jgi:hypothetical protein
MSDEASGNTKEPSAVLNQSFQQVTQYLRQRERELEDRERELEHREKALQLENPFKGTCSDVLRLSVTGTRMDLLRRTLTAVEGSLLAAQFSGRWDDNLPVDKDGRILINQPHELFKPMIDFLLDKECETPLTGKAVSPHFDDARMKMRFYRMVEYYQMTLGVYPFTVCKVNSPEGIGSVVGSHPDYAVESTSGFASFAVVPENDHPRRILSFEVTVGTFTSISVGWSVANVKDIYTEFPEGRGVGYATTSIALDASKASVVHKISDDYSGGVTTANIHISGLSIKEGSVIRCEDFGNRWLVDGVLIASNKVEEGSRTITGWTPRPKTIPFVSCQGCFRFSKIELEFQ